MKVDIYIYIYIYIYIICSRLLIKCMELIKVIYSIKLA